MYKDNSCKKRGEWTLITFLWTIYSGFWKNGIKTIDEPCIKIFLKSYLTLMTASSVWNAFKVIKTVFNILKWSRNYKISRQWIIIEVSFNSFYRWAFPGIKRFTV